MLCKCYGILHLHVDPAFVLRMLSFYKVSNFRRVGCYLVTCMCMMWCQLFTLNCTCCGHRLAVKGKETVATCREFKYNFHLNQSRRSRRKFPGKKKLKSYFIHSALPRSHPTHRPKSTQKTLVPRDCPNIASRVPAQVPTCSLTLLPESWYKSWCPILLSLSRCAILLSLSRCAWGVSPEASHDESNKVRGEIWASQYKSLPLY
jgi:hypothetical protein